MVVDNFLANPDEVRAHALKQVFVAKPDYFRGKRTEQSFLNEDLRRSFAMLLGSPIPEWTKYDTNGVFQICTAGEQLVYHSDHQQWAGTIYLTPNAPPSAGMTLYRSRRTLGRTVRESMEIHSPGSYAMDVALAKQMEAEMYSGKLLDRTAWEPVDVIGNVYNRLVLWNGQMVHAASDYFGSTLEDCRLFQMFFFDTSR